MSIQYKSIKELKNMLNDKDISHTELVQETFVWEVAGGRNCNAS